MSSSDAGSMCPTVVGVQFICRRSRISPRVIGVPPLQYLLLFRFDARAPRQCSGSAIGKVLKPESWWCWVGFGISILLSSYVASDMVSTRLICLVNHVLKIVLLDLFYSKKVHLHCLESIVVASLSSWYPRTLLINNSGEYHPTIMAFGQCLLPI